MWNAFGSFPPNILNLLGMINHDSFLHFYSMGFYSLKCVCHRRTQRKTKKEKTREKKNNKNVFNVAFHKTMLVL